MERINEIIKFGDTRYAIEVGYKSSNGKHSITTLYTKSIIKESEALDMINKGEPERGEKADFIESIKVAEAYTPMEFHFPSRAKYEIEYRKGDYIDKTTKDGGFPLTEDAYYEIIKGIETDGFIVTKVELLHSNLLKNNCPVIPMYKYNQDGISYVCRFSVHEFEDGIKTHVNYNKYNYSVVTFRAPTGDLVKVKVDRILPIEYVDYSVVTFRAPTGDLVKMKSDRILQIEYMDYNDQYENFNDLVGLDMSYERIGVVDIFKEEVIDIEENYLANPGVRTTDTNGIIELISKFDDLIKTASEYTRIDKEEIVEALSDNSKSYLIGLIANVDGFEERVNRILRKSEHTNIQTLRENIECVGKALKTAEVLTEMGVKYKRGAAPVIVRIGDVLNPLNAFIVQDLNSSDLFKIEELDYENKWEVRFINRILNKIHGGSILNIVDPRIIDKSETINDVMGEMWLESSEYQSRREVELSYRIALKSLTFLMSDEYLDVRTEITDSGLTEGTLCVNKDFRLAYQFTEETTNILKMFIPLNKQVNATGLRSILRNRLSF